MFFNYVAGLVEIGRRYADQPNGQDEAQAYWQKDSSPSSEPGESAAPSRGAEGSSVRMMTSANISGTREQVASSRYSILPVTAIVARAPFLLEEQEAFLPRCSSTYGNHTLSERQGSVVL